MKRAAQAFACAVTLFFTQAHAAATEHVRRVGHKAVTALQHGLATGEWVEFFGMLHEHVNFWFPTKREYHHGVGKQVMVDFFTGMNDGKRPPGLGVRFVEPLRITIGESHYVWEGRVQASNPEGKLIYQNRIMLSLDVCGEQICTYREYFGSDRNSN